MAVEQLAAEGGGKVEVARQIGASPPAAGGDRLGLRVRLLSRPHRRFHLLQGTLQAGCQTVRQQTDGPPFPPAHVAPHLHSLGLDARMEPVRRQCALPLPAPRTLRCGCVLLGAPVNIFLVGQVCRISNLQGWADHGPAGLTRGPPESSRWCQRRGSGRVIVGVLPWRIFNFRTHGLRIL